MPEAPPECPMPPDCLAGAGVFLRRPLVEDAEQLFPIASDPEVVQFMVWPRHVAIQETRDFLAGSAERWGRREEFAWVIEGRADRQVIGSIGCRIEGHSADFGYYLARTAWGRGLAFESALLVLDWLKAQPRIRSIQATSDGMNVRSIRLLERLGMTCEGTTALPIIRPNLGSSPRDTLVFTLSHDDD